MYKHLSFNPSPERNVLQRDAFNRAFSRQAVGLSGPEGVRPPGHARTGRVHRVYQIGGPAVVGRYSLTNVLKEAYDADGGSGFSVYYYNRISPGGAHHHFARWERWQFYIDPDGGGGGTGTRIDISGTTTVAQVGSAIRSVMHGIMNTEFDGSASEGGSGEITVIQGPPNGAPFLFEVEGVAVAGQTLTHDLHAFCTRPLAPRRVGPSLHWHPVERNSADGQYVE